MTMGHRVTGVSGFGFGVQWEKKDGDREIAHAVLRFMEDRRLLFGVRIYEDAGYCVESAGQCRQFLTSQLSRPDIGPEMTATLQAVRAAMRRFMDHAGPGGRHLRNHGHGGLDPFSVALGELRGVVGQHLALIAFHFGIEVEGDLFAIFPAQDDPTIVPGFE